MNLPAPTTTSACGNCGLTTRWFLHDVNLRGTERRLCTSCVLRQNPSSFCPSCFEFFDHPLSATSSASPNRFLSCVECSSLTHLRCLPSPHPSPTTFRCPRCSSPTPSSFSLFPIDRSTPRQLDASLAAVLLCAAKIAAASISRAHSSAKAKADRSVREAAAARKRARDALDHLCAVEMARRAAVEGSMEVSGSRNLGIRKVINPVNGNANANSNGLSENKNGLRGNNNNNNNNNTNNNSNNNGSAASDDGK